LVVEDFSAVEEKADKKVKDNQALFNSRKLSENLELFKSIGNHRASMSLWVELSTLRKHAEPLMLLTFSSQRAHAPPSKCYKCVRSRKRPKPQRKQTMALGAFAVARRALRRNKPHVTRHASHGGGVASCYRMNFNCKGGGGGGRAVAERGTMLPAMVMVMVVVMTMMMLMMMMMMMHVKNHRSMYIG
jgi:hypothetical protein